MYRDVRKGREFHGGPREWAREREDKRGRTVTEEAAGGFGEKGSGEVSCEGGAVLGEGFRDGGSGR